MKDFRKYLVENSKKALGISSAPPDPSSYVAPFSQEEIDQKSMIRILWTKLLDVCEIVQDDLRKVQGKYKKQLTRDVKVLGVPSGLLSAVVVETPLEALFCE